VARWETPEAIRKDVDIFLAADSPIAEFVWLIDKAWRRVASGDDVGPWTSNSDLDCLRNGSGQREAKDN